MFKPVLKCYYVYRFDLLIAINTLRYSIGPLRKIAIYWRFQAKYKFNDFDEIFKLLSLPWEEVWLYLAMSFTLNSDSLSLKFFPEIFG